MAETTYHYPDVPDQSAGCAHEAIEESAITGVLLRVDQTVGDLHAVFADALSAPDIVILDALIDSLILDLTKRHKREAIDFRSRELIALGHEYTNIDPSDPSDPSAVLHMFSLSPQAQRNLLGMIISAELLEYPIEMNSLQDTATLILTDPSDVAAFYSNAVQTIRDILDGGTSLKKLVNEATTVEEVDAIIDMRGLDDPVDHGGSLAFQVGNGIAYHFVGGLISDPPPPSNSASFGFWLRPLVERTGRHVLMTYHDSATKGLWLETNGNVLRGFVNNADAIASMTATITIDTYWFVGWTSTPGQMVFYLGQYDPTGLSGLIKEVKAVTSIAPNFNSCRLHIGGTAAGIGSARARMCEVNMWDGVEPDARFDELYAGGAGLTESALVDRTNLMGFWPGGIPSAPLVDVHTTGYDLPEFVGTAPIVYAQPGYSS